MKDAEKDTTSEAALNELTDDQRLAYSRLLGGLKGLLAGMPTECTDENEKDVGARMKKARAAKKLAADSLADIAGDSSALVKRQRDLWKPLGELAADVIDKGKALVSVLLAKQVNAREAEDRATRERVAAAQKKQQEAEAKALAAQTTEAREAASKQADLAWSETKSAVAAMEKAPSATKAKVGETTVYETKRLDFEVVDMGAFAAAHPDLVTVKREPTLSALREATGGMTELPETLAGWPGLKLKTSKTTASR